MIRRLAVAVMVVLWAGPASAEWFGIGRAGFMGGAYNVSLEFTVRDINGALVDRDKFSQTRSALGVFGGYTFVTGIFFGDMAVEYQSTGSKGEDLGAGEETISFDRTELLPSIGIFLPRDFAVSAGYRVGWQGDGLFDKRFYRERGPFFSVGFPSFALVGDWALTTSAAVNFTKIRIEGIPDIDFLGISLRGVLSQPDSPHAFGARIQRFSGDESETVGGNTGKLDIAETYFHLFYQYSFLEMSR